MTNKFEYDLEKGHAPKPIQYAYNVALACSQLVSAVLGGDPDESISSRTGKASRAGKWWFKAVQEPVIDFLIVKGHCQQAIEDEEGQKQLWDWAK